MPASLALVESNTSGTGRLFARAARARGLAPVLLTAEPGRYPFAAEDRLDVVLTDTRDDDAVIAACRALAAGSDGGGGLRGVTTSSDYYVVTAAIAARALGLPGPSPEALAACRDKEEQRRRLARAGVAIPRFMAAASPGEAGEAAAALGLPVVVKPVTGSGSVGVRWCGDRAAVESHAAALLARRTNERGMPIPPRVLVEEAVTGAELSVERLADTIVGVTGKHLGPLPDFVEIGHDFPAPVPPPVAEALAACASAAVDALELRDLPTHTELRWGARGPVVIEVNPRLAGGFIPELVRLARGVDLIDATIALACGEPPALAPRAASHAALRFVLCPGDGRVAQLAGLDAARGIEHVADVALYVAPGAEIARRGDFRDRIGHVIARAAEPGPAARAAAAALGCIRVEVR
ncbi:MAG TPA: ATP-grasp domain-containing protein [Kofleriaceae bacterium]|nr:ATP-grasp domain-containing protein [Kofleriaceae bacterium]